MNENTIQKHMYYIAITYYTIVQKYFYQETCTMKQRHIVTRQKPQTAWTTVLLS